MDWDAIDRRMVLSAGAGTILAPALARAMPPATEPRSDGFDFLLGRWDVRHRKLRRRLAGCGDWDMFDGSLDVGSILGGLGNFDVNRLDDPAGEYEAHSLRLYNPAARNWSIWWLDARAPGIGSPVVGNFAGAKGSFFNEELFEQRPVRVRTTYEPLTRDHAQWTQAFSADDGATWEVNWIMDFRRAA